MDIVDHCRGAGQSIDATAKWKRCGECQTLYTRKRKQSWTEWRKSSRYCSVKCKCIAQNKTRYPGRVMAHIVCGNCNADFIRSKTTGRSGRKYCSKDCWNDIQQRDQVAFLYTKKENAMTTNNTSEITPAFEALTTDEAKELTCFEETISRGLKTFMEVGEALEEIRSRRLYRSTHSKWEDYLRDRWKMDKKAARDFIGAYRISTFVQENLPGQEPPRSKAAALGLMDLKEDPDALLEAYSEAASKNGGKAPSETQVRAAVDSRVGVASSVRRDQRRRSEWVEGRFQVETPSVSISLTAEEAMDLARQAQDWELSLPETARKLVVRALTLVRG